MARREFPAKVRVAVIKRATRTTEDGVSNLYCEKCGRLAKRFQIDHVVADSHGGPPTLENAELLGPCCFEPKNAKDTKIAAKIKRQEIGHLGARITSGRKLQGPSFPQSSKRKAHPMPALPPRSLYEATHD